ncbi:hypothetical protein LJK88_09670 [Paenibacillus sp. P26]|nr:hypothetical protein LJK88_09670 [Paenibacillus sp. P26]UUZ89869.1 hypothetical protein LJK87_27955 [Paenibacillus sp. P25]
MKPAVMRKTAQVTALMLLISILLPVLAFANSGFGTDLSYRNSTVTGTVYSDVYDSNVQQNVYLYDPSGNLISTTQATYSSVDGNVYKYGFSSVISNTYSYLRLKWEPVKADGKVSDSVYQSVYRTSTDTSSPGGGYYGGGGGGSSSGSQSISVNSDGTVDATTLENALKSYDEITLNLSGDKALIPAKALKNYTGDSKKLLKVVNSNGQYNLPLFVLKLDDLAGKVSSTVDDLTIQVTIAKASQSIADSVYAATNALGATLASNIIDFDIVGLAKDGKTASTRPR